MTGEIRERATVKGLANWRLGSPFNPWGRAIRDVGLYNATEAFSMGSGGSQQFQAALPKTAKQLRATLGWGISQVDPKHGHQNTSGAPNTRLMQKAMEKQRSQERQSTRTTTREYDPID